MNIDFIKNKLEDLDGYELGLVYESHLFQWIDPRNIRGINTDFCRKKNREKYQDKHSEDEGDDELVAEYLYQCKSQRAYYSVHTSNSQHLISELEYFDALLFLTQKYWTNLDFTTIDRSSLAQKDYAKMLSMVTQTLDQINELFVKKNLIDFTYNVFCYAFVSPDLENYPKLKSFLQEDSNIEKLESLNY